MGWDACCEKKHTLVGLNLRADCIFWDDVRELGIQLRSNLFSLNKIKELIYLFKQWMLLLVPLCFVELAAKSPGCSFLVGRW